MTTAIDTSLPETRPHILVAGLGNSILQDDGIGVHAALTLVDDLPPGVVAAEVGTAVLDALHLFEWADFVLTIDAMEAGGHPGDIYLLDARQVAGGAVQTSLHELGLKATLRFAQTPVTHQVVMIGVEPERIDYSLELTPALQEALPRVVALARRVVEYWRGGGDAGVSSLEEIVELAEGVPLKAHLTATKGIDSCLV